MLSAATPSGGAPYCQATPLSHKMRDALARGAREGGANGGYDQRATRADRRARGATAIAGRPRAARAGLYHAQDPDLRALLRRGARRHSRRMPTASWRTSASRSAAMTWRSTCSRRPAAGATARGCGFPPGLVRSIIRRARRAAIRPACAQPRSQRAHRRRCEVFSPSYGSPFVADVEGGRRYGSIGDFENFVKLAYVSPVAAPFRRHRLRAGRSAGQQAASRRWSMRICAVRQAVHGVGDDRASAPPIRSSMCRVLFGAEFVERIASSSATSMSTRRSCSTARRAGSSVPTRAANQAAVCVPFILGGAMGPVTTAAGLAQCFAEAMVCVALAQLERRARRRSSAISSPRCL